MNKITKNALLVGVCFILVVTTFLGSVKADDNGHIKENSDIKYIENGFIKTQETGLIGNYTIDTFTTKSNDEIEIKLKKEVGLEENNNMNRDLNNIPARLYIKDDYDDFIGEDTYSLVDTKYLNLKTKEEDIITFKLPDDCDYDNYKVEVGFGTVSYSGITDSIYVNDGNYVWSDVYTVGNTNNVIQKYNQSLT